VRGLDVKDCQLNDGLNQLHSSLFIVNKVCRKLERLHRNKIQSRRATVSVTRGRRYDHNFLRFLPIFGEKIGGFLKDQCYDQIILKFGFVLIQKRQFFRKNFWRNYF
jgi:hypothetical protein